MSSLCLHSCEGDCNLHMYVLCGLPIKVIHLTPSHGSGWSTMPFTTFPSHFITHSRLVWVFQPDLIYLHQGIEQYIIQYHYDMYYSILPPSHHIVMAGAHVSYPLLQNHRHSAFQLNISQPHSPSPPGRSNSHHTTQLT